ncbi:MAG: signal peptidase I [Planctomycetes bacterium]|nr:signal peptidase I [Planctomycetota bacterium]
MTKTKKIPLMGPIRVNLEAFGVAILAAVLLKWFCIEAYQIPTSSMQPTLMGDQSSKVFDRILVDKLLQTFRDPQRWDITVFRYPLQKNQNYVKRIVGMPNDHLHIAAGNIYQVREQDGKLTYEIERKPDDLQEALWKEVYPARRLVLGEGTALGASWNGSSSSITEDADGFAMELSSSTRRLYFRDTSGKGLTNLDWDGYPTAVAIEIQKNHFLTQPPEIVPDARLAATLIPNGKLAEVAFEIVVNRPGLDKLTFALQVEGGKGKLQVTAGAAVAAESPPFDVELTQGRATRLRFAHVDDRLIAWVDGTEVQRLDTATWHCRAGCVSTKSDSGFEFAPGQIVTPQIVCKGSGSLRIDDVVLERDLHYTRYDAPEIIEVPEGHYYMMGDNTLQSIDSRGWTAITVGVTDDNRIVAPPPPGGAPGVRPVRGNKRAMSLANAPDRDETPIPIPSHKAIVMIDEYGEILRLQGEAGDNWGAGGKVVFRGEDGTEWEAPDTTNTKGVSFVPRSDIQGRGLMVFYPVIPFSWLLGNNWPNRFGFVR